MRICLISDRLTDSPDEGKGKFAYCLLKALEQWGPVLGLCTGRKKSDDPSIRSLSTNRLLLSYRVASAIRRFQPDFIFYVPSSNATPFSFLRSRLLKVYYPRSKVVLVTLQPHSYGWFWRILMPFLAPDLTFVQSARMLRGLGRIDGLVRLLPSGVDLETFIPVSAARRAALRRQYGFKEDAFIMLHVGHIREERNVSWLKEVQRLGQAVLVGSTTTRQDGRVKEDLLRAGVQVIDRFTPRIQELYQLSDCYLFPVLRPGASIEVPLSVLEAMACNLPVVATRYGGLPRLFPQGLGLYYADNLTGVIDSVLRARSMNGCRTRELVAPFAWPRIAEQLLFELGGKTEKG